MNLKNKKSQNYFDTLRGKTPNKIKTLTKKERKKHNVVNIDSILPADYEDESKTWFKEIDPSKLGMGKKNQLEDFFLANMNMRHAFNKVFAQMMGKLFYMSYLCLPVYLFRSDICMARVLFGSDQPRKSLTSQGSCLIGCVCLIEMVLPDQCQLTGRIYNKCWLSIFIVFENCVVV